MDVALLVIVLLIAALAILGGTIFSLRYFSTSDRPKVVKKPRQVHDAATTAELKRFFEGKACAECGRPIPPVHMGDRRPGLLNTETNETLAWDDIPAANLSETLDSHVPICANCVISEIFRREHPDLVVDRHRTVEHPSH